MKATKKELIKNMLENIETNGWEEVTLLSVIKCSDNYYKLYDNYNYVPNELGYMGDKTCSAYSLDELMEKLDSKYPDFMDINITQI